MAHPGISAFFSYCRVDGEFVRRLAQDLKRAEVNVWMDQLDIAPGVAWDVAVETALKQSSLFLVVLSPVSVASENVRDEVAFALSKQKRVIPILYRDCDVPFRVARLQYIDFRSEYAEGLRALLKAVQGVSPEEPEQREKVDWMEQCFASAQAEQGSGSLRVTVTGRKLRRQSRRWMVGAALVVMAFLAWLAFHSGSKKGVGDQAKAPMQTEAAKAPAPIEISKPPAETAVSKASTQRSISKPPAQTAVATAPAQTTAAKESLAALSLKMHSPGDTGKKAQEKLSASIQAALDKWARTMTANDPKAQAAAYAPHVDRFLLKENVDNAYVLSYLKDFHDNHALFRSFKIDGRSLIIFNDDGTVEVDLLKVYMLELVNTHEKKEVVKLTELHMTAIGSEWKITYENDRAPAR